MGTTGARERLDDRLAGLVGTVKEAAGDTPRAGRLRHLAARSTWRPCSRAGADGAVVGSAAIDAADRGGAAELEEFVRSLATALR